MANSNKINKEINSINVPIYSRKDGQIQANTLFHRSYDKLHSRCIEYPYAASMLVSGDNILDVGTVKADKYWLIWLESLKDRNVFAVDFDKPKRAYSKINFLQSDVRNIHFEDNFFDVIFAVSVIEHIGLEDSQVNKRDKPEIQDDGDVEAVKELTRVLKPGGRLIMTFPYGVREGVMKNKQARTYTHSRIKKFERYIKPLVLDYYEYQSVSKNKIFKEVVSDLEFIISRIKRVLNLFVHQNRKSSSVNLSSYNGSVLWRKIDIKKTEAVNQEHVDGVLCGVWKKRMI